MAEIADRLRIKYGLRSNPTNAQIVEWARRTRDEIRVGHDPEETGRSVAKIVFPDFGSYTLRAEADTIEALLREAGKK
jgi:hypothetical protein